MLKIEDYLARLVCQRADLEGAIAPAPLQNNLFTIGAYDNVDHNPSSNTAQGSGFHGTAISLFQIDNSDGIPRPPTEVEIDFETPINLPDFYTHIEPLSANTKGTEVPGFVRSSRLTSTNNPSKDPSSSIKEPSKEQVKENKSRETNADIFVNSLDEELLKEDVSEAIIPSINVLSEDCLQISDQCELNIDENDCVLEVGSLESAHVSCVMYAEDGTKIASILPNTVNTVPDALIQEMEWVDHVRSCMQVDNLTNQSVCWSSYHASKERCPPKKVDVGTILPIFSEKSSEPQMVAHGMTIIRNSTKLLNPNQIPVSVFDLPLFVQAKLIQWRFPNTFGEKLHVVMMGGLHVEMAYYCSLGDILQGSGWTESLAEAGITTSETAELF